MMLDPTEWKFRPKKDSERARQEDEDDDDDGPRPSAGAVVARFFPFFRPIPRLVPTV